MRNILVVLLALIAAGASGTTRVEAGIGQCHYRADQSPSLNNFSGFYLVISKRPDKEELVITWKPQSVRPEKQLIELQLAECVARDWFHNQYIEVLKKQVKP